MQTSEPNDYGEIDCKCNRCGDLKQSLEFIISTILTNVVDAMRQYHYPIPKTFKGAICNTTSRQ